MTDDLEKLAEWLTPLINRLDAGQRNKLMKSVAWEMRLRNRARIRSQTDPDGKRWKARRVRQPINDPVSFIYSGERRLMVSWQDQGDRMTGFDRESGGIKTFVKDRIDKWLPKPDRASIAGGGGMSGRKGRIRRQAMFTKIRTSRFLRINTNPNAAAIQWIGRVAEIARIHQFGERAPLSDDGPVHNFAQRRLIGFSRDDHRFIADHIINHLADL